MANLTVTRADVLTHRAARHQLDRAAGSAQSPRDVELLDLGVLDTGAPAGSWALANRGAPPAGPDELVRVWTLRGAPHLYRRSDLVRVAVATAPFSEADAAKRVLNAARPLREAGIPVLDALTIVARHLREIARDPVAKGDASSRLTAMVGDPYLRDCPACGVLHPFEMPFRLAAFQAGLELCPDTSPPVLRRIPGFEPAMFGHLAGGAVPRFDVVRGYLRFFGPASPPQVAAYLDAPVRDVRAAWPQDAVPVTVAGQREDGLALLAEDEAALRGPGGRARDDGSGVRLLGPGDPYLAARDHELLLPDAAARKELWRALGRPGAVLARGEIVASWRSVLAGGRLGVTIHPFGGWTSSYGRLAEEQAALLAEHRGATDVSVTVVTDRPAVAV